MTTPQDFKSLEDRIKPSLIATVKSVSRIAAEDLPFQRAVNPNVGEDLDSKTTRLLELSTTLLKSAADYCGLKAPELEDADDVDMRWRSIVDVIDSVLEKADTSIDEYTGALKRKDAPTAEATHQTKKSKTTGAVVRNANITKPQVHFDQAVDNNAPWKPIITKKPHATLPLEQSLQTSKTDDGFVYYKHPYETEILEAKFPDRVFQHAEPIPWQPIDTTEAIYVDTFEGVLEMLEDLKKAKEIAVDLEHHDFRTYVGLTSLMQISTREKDWIIDTLKPWRQQLEVLNEVFADPSIIKVFHGAFMDMVWLQRDLGLYVNGLFDTFHACDALHYPQKSLAYLLKKFVNFDADKKYQLADWRVRPLSDEMLYYARSDTHYLLYIYDKIRNELVMKSDRSNPETDYIEAVLQNSKAVALTRYEGENFDPATGKGNKGWYNTLLKHPMPFSGQQFAVYRAIWAWRDEVARREDESTFFVLPNGIIGEIAKHMPPDAKALHALIPNNAYIARRNVTDLFKRYQEAREKGINEPRLFDFLKSDLPRAGTKSVVVDLVEDVADPVLEPTHLDQSQLFGGMALSSAWETTGSAASGLGEFVMLPWQRFVENAITTEASVQQDVAMEGGVEAEWKAPTAAATQEPEPVEEEFTLKTGMKRKASAVDASEASDNDSDSDYDSVDFVLERAGSDQTPSKKGKHDPSERQAKSAKKRAEKVARYTEEYEEAEAEVKRLTEEVAQQRAEASQLQEAQEVAKEKQMRLQRYVTALNNRRTKSEKKAAKKAAKAQKEAEKEAKKDARKAEKRAKKAKEVQQADGASRDSSDSEEEDAFDYSQATSVLHANRTGNRGVAPKKPTFDPYAKTGDDAPKGARKAPPPRGERSATFKK
ncbi:Exosome complex exonuclease rrp6 [Colletotrichum chlorophyti]|uniref:Exosome complex exonuclease rrp6 n=1 Tax=Colletotrichum chlorophyti TaxID=708187 RepID=A0A1Q8RAJ1_9PEZI|nr:Exosome complex exonuclease rrp6 [Colletotrichum chlorophyti]